MGLTFIPSDAEWNSNHMNTNKVVRTGEDRRATLVLYLLHWVNPEGFPRFPMTLLIASLELLHFSGHAQNKRLGEGKGFGEEGGLHADSATLTAYTIEILDLPVATVEPPLRKGQPPNKGR